MTGHVTNGNRWEILELRDVCAFRHGGTPSKAVASYWQGSIPWVSPKDMRSVTIERTEDAITEEAVRDSSTSIVPAKTVLVVTRSGILARTFPVAVTGRPVAFNQDIKALLPLSDRLDPWFLYWLLRFRQPDILSQGVKKGATVHSLRSGFLEALLISVPPLSEQRRIAVILKEQLAAVERARAAAEERARAARRLRSAYLEQEFAGSEAERWPRMRLADLLLAPLKTGISRRGSPAAQKRCLTLSSIRDGRLDLSASKPADVSDEEAAGNWVQPAAFYVVRGNGNLSLVGRGGLAPAAVEQPVVYPDLLIQVVLRPDLVLGEYLRLAWDTRAVRRDIELRARTSAGIHKINQQNLANILVPVPPLEQQARVVKLLDRFGGVASAAEQSAEAELAAVNVLPAALLRSAFSGAL